MKEVDVSERSSMVIKKQASPQTMLKKTKMLGMSRSTLTLKENQIQRHQAGHSQDWDSEKPHRYLMGSAADDIAEEDKPRKKTIQL